MASLGQTYIEQYYQEILKGNIIVGEKIERIYAQLVHDIHNPAKFQVLQMDGTYKEVTFIFDENRANEPIDFIETPELCKQSKSPYTGQPVFLTLWEKALIQAVYGFVDSGTGYRRYQEVILEIGRKNGKSTLMSGLGAYHMALEKGYEICCGANIRAQAEIIFQETKNMIMQSSILSKNIKKRKYDLYNPSRFNIMKAVANNGNLDGLNTDIFLCDEIHEFKDTPMYDLIKQGQGVKFEPLIFMVTTNGFVRDNFFDEKLEYANNVLNGVIIDHTFLPILYELDAKNQEEAEIEIQDKRNWAKTNPSIGIFRTFSDIDKLLKQTIGNKIARAKLLAKYFNIPQSDTYGWLTYYEAVNEETFNIEEFRGCYCVGGVDLSAIGDLTTATILFMKPGSDKKYIWQKSWIPKDLLKEKEERDKVPYSKWVENGFIDLSGDTKIDYNDVTQWFIDMGQTYDLYIKWIGYDSWNSQYWIKQMKDTGFEMEEVRQGFKTFTVPLKELTADFKAHKIVHNNNPVTLMGLLNTRIEVDKNENQRPVKGKNLTKRIDPMVSLLDSYVVLHNNYDEFTNSL